MRKILAIRCILLLCTAFNGGCIGTIVGEAADVAIEVVKVPFKAGAAIVDAVSSDNGEKTTNKKKDAKKE